jgi:hypothetical protein
LAALAGCGCGSFTNISSRLLRPTSVPTALALLAPDQIALPVTGELAVLNLGRAHMDAEHVGELAALIQPLAA